MKKVELTDYQVWVLNNALGIWNNRLASKTETPSYEVLKKVLAIKKATSVVVDAIQQTNPTVKDLMDKKEISSYELPQFTEKELEESGLAFSVDALEALEPLL
jgi:hypothetical protein